jgi:hypothetical protein
MNDSGAGEFMLSEKSSIFFESTKLALKANHKIDTEDRVENLGELFTLPKTFFVEGKKAEKFSENF